jgi:hypothetical protein
MLAIIKNSAPPSYTRDGQVSDVPVRIPRVALSLRKAVHRVKYLIVIPVEMGMAKYLTSRTGR